MSTDRDIKPENVCLCDEPLVTARACTRCGLPVLEKRRMRAVPTAARSVPLSLLDE